MTSGINWLSVDGSWADPGSSPNGALNVSGSFYVFSDSCALVQWDPMTRCATGVLCDPGPSFENWGVAIGFDFHNTGAKGAPPNTKLPWNATSVGAKGIAWKLTGSAPGLQVWITNMDPIFNGQCSLDSCDIAGPPDGTATPKLAQSLLFNSLVKDDWGGAGTPYVFDRSDILAVQFKLAAIVASGEAFSYCVDQLGVILP